MSLVNYGDRFDLPPIDYDQSKVPQKIKERVDGVREAVFGTQNKEFIAQAVEIAGLTAREAEQIAENNRLRQENLESETAQSVAQMEADKDAVIANATVDSEVILARGGKTTLGQRLDDTTAQLAQIAISYRALGLKGDGTDSSQSIIDAIASLEGQKITLNLANGVFNVTSRLSIPNGVNLTGINPVINYNDYIDFLGDQVIENITFDGGDSCHYLQFKGSNINFRYNTSKNVKARTEIGTASLWVGGTNKLANIIIYRNKFLNITPYVENGIEGDAIGSAKAIIVSNSDAEIIGNEFDGLNGFEDGDYIYITAAMDTSFGLPYTIGRANDVKVTIKDNTFHLASKGAIKIQASGCIVENNKIYITDGQSEAAIRVFSCSDIVIENNKFFIEHNGRVRAFHTSQSERVTFENNKVLSKRGLAEATGGIFFIADANDVTIRGNYADIVNRKYLFNVKRIKGATIENNTINASFDTFTLGSFELLNTGFVGNNERVTFKNNTISVISSTAIDLLAPIYDELSLSIDNLVVNGNVGEITLDVRNSNTDNVLINDLKTLAKVKLSLNHFTGASSSNQIKNVTVKNSKVDLVTAYYTDSLTLENIEGVDDASYYFQSTNVGSLKLSKSELNGVYANLFRIYSGNTKIDFINNAVKNNTVSAMNVSGNTEFVQSSFKYSKGSKPLLRYDFGTTEQRPTCTLDVGHKYYDTSTGKEYLYDSVNWRDSTGAVI